MIEVYINPTRVERVVFASGSDLEEDFDLAAWVTIRPLVDRINRALRKSAKEFLRASELAANSKRPVRAKENANGRPA